MDFEAENEPIHEGKTPTPKQKFWKRFSMLDYTKEEMAKSTMETLFALPKSEDVVKACKEMRLPLDGRLRVAMFPATENACGYYRMAMPSRELNKQSSDSIVVKTFAKLTPEVLRWADVIVIQEMQSAQALSFIERFAFDRILVSEQDDNLMETPPSNPWYNRFNQVADTMAVYMRWLRMVDAHQFSTRPLEEYWKEYRDPIGWKMEQPSAVLENSVRESEVLTTRRATHTHESPILGWAGGNNHLEDLPMLNEPIAELQSERKILWRMLGWDGWYQNVNIGNALPDVETDLYLPPCRPEAFTRMLERLDLDLGLAPLADTVFNASRSNIKLLSYTAAGISVVASDVAPYRDFPGVLTVSNDREEWKQVISMLMDDQTARDAMLFDARTELLENYTIEKRAAKWGAFYAMLDDQFSGKIKGRIEE